MSEAWGSETEKQSAIFQQARKELDDEYFREAVEAEKARLREWDGRSLWARVFPWRILIRRR